MPTHMSRLFAELLERFTDDEPLAVTVFAAGFVTGQAEKVWCGACKAAMFRPETPAHDNLLDEIIPDVAGHYGLSWERFRLQGEIEYWIATSENWGRVVEVLTEGAEVNSPTWHLQRAALCGVSTHQVDLEYHKQKV